MADITDIKRLNYYEGEYLGAVDFEAEQEYHRDMRRRHNLGPHTLGIITGLEIVQFPNGGANNEVDVYIQPGMAVDAFGREIVLFSPLQLTSDMFADFIQKSALSIWIGYNQQMIQPAQDTCATAGLPNAYNRVQESYQVVIQPVSQNGPLVVDGKDVLPPKPASVSSSLPSTAGDVAVPADGSVPYQALPDDNTTATWLLKLGQVMWDGPNQRFLNMAAANFGRTYAGMISASVYAPMGSLMIANRFGPSPLPTDPNDPNYNGLSVEIAGELQVDRFLNAEQNALIGALYDPTTMTNLSPLTVVASGANEDLIQFRNPSAVETWYINEKGGGTAGLNIGEVSAGNVIDGRIFIQPTAVMPNVGIGTMTPRNPLAVRAQGTWQELVSFEDRDTHVTRWHLNQNPQGSDAQGNKYTPGLNFCETQQANFRLFLQENTGNVGIGTPLPQQNLSVLGGLNIDQGDANSGTISPGPALSFGSGSGEGIGSTRSGGNRFGLEFYTGSALRLKIANSGVVTTSGDLVVGAGAVSQQAPPQPGVLSVNGNRTFLLGTDAANTHWIMAGGFQEFPPGGTSTTPGNNALGFSYHPAQGFGRLTINPNWALVALGGLSVQGRVDVSGDLHVEGKLFLGGFKGGYVVDLFINRSGGKFERGDVVVLHEAPSSHYYGTENHIPLIEVQLTDKAHDTRVCGIVDEPSLSEEDLRDLNRGKMGSLPIGVMVTLGAYAYCKVDADIAPVSPGNLLTTSPTPGHAQVLRSGQEAGPGAVIAKALGALTKGKGMIPVLVSHQ